jgi:hypothetical protein
MWIFQRKIKKQEKDRSVLYKIKMEKINPEDVTFVIPVRFLHHPLWDSTIGASVTNLFDRRQYGYTEYKAVQSYTSWIQIRGWELLVSTKYRF